MVGMGSELLTTGALLAVASWLVVNSKAIGLSIWNKIRSLCVYSIYFEETNGFYPTFSKWFLENYPQKFRRTEVKIHTLNTLPKYKLSFLQFIDYNVIWYQKRFIVIRKNREKLEAAKDIFSVYLNNYTVYGFFAKDAIRSLSETILKKKEELAGNIVLSVKTNNSFDGFHERDFSHIKDFNKLFFKDKETLLKDLQYFENNKESYKKLGINYKRGYFLYGCPGTGKTSIAMAIAHKLKRVLYSINLASVKSDASLQQLIGGVPNGSCVLFEDIDSILQGRQTEDGIKFNFATFLNVLDGLHAPEDVVFVTTTNKPELIDGAILRKGRTDLALEIGLPRNKDIQDYINNYYASNIKLPNPDAINNVPMSEIQNSCLSNPKINEAFLNTLCARN